ncbi:MAG: SEC-C metal-binding domain-containing protein [Clostridium sp.]|nr:SEC-C metal-binding domain-containing protein [Clostridium sp.]
MSLYKDWTDMAVDYVRQHGQEAFWKEYGTVEKRIYIKLLGNHKNNVKGKICDLAAENETSSLFFMGFLDGINDSITEPLDLETLNEKDEVELKVDFSKLYYNMLDAKADYLYDLPQWEGIFSKEKRKEIHTQWKDSKTIVKKKKIGRNDPCPCGSGKKYKNCCGRK